MELVEAERAAVFISGAVKAYGSGDDVTLVLNHLNMSVPKGSIYGLLGASGCGKTTLLGCISGRLRLREGEIRVLGSVPGSRDSDVPGPRIGYMPQELALVNEFTVKDVFYYFGWLFGMSSSEIRDRFDFISDLLQLPAGNALVKNLSGGQARRVSFAAALIQNPELLVLDEPTVGLDPVLRQNIWDYLVQLSRDQGTTIIITTHYIEEARQADKIGLMRQGTLLAEDCPDVLISRYECGTLENVFLILSRNQNSSTDNAQSCSLSELQSLELKPRVEEMPQKPQIKTKEKQPATPSIIPLKQPMRTSPLNKMRALLYKNYLRVSKSNGTLFFLFLFPILEISCFFVAVGGKPRGMRLGIVNEEQGDCRDFVGDVRNYSGVDLSPGGDTCRLYGISCLFVNRLNDSTTLHIYYDDEESALLAARKGYTYGYLHFPSNFSEQLELRGVDGSDATNATLEGSEMSVWLDMSNNKVGLSLTKYLLDSYFKLAEELSERCNVSIKQAQIPVHFNDPVFGKNDSSFSLFMAPGVVLSMIFFCSLMSTADVIITERTEGLWERNIAAGVTTTEILLSHMVVQSVMSLIQITIALILGFQVFGMTCYGDFSIVFTLVFLQGMAGIVCGLIISSNCRDLTQASFVSMGSLYPYILLGGLIWPLEGMPPFLRVISNMLPGTWATTALRNVLEKGWGWTHAQVWPGLGISFTWFVLVAVASGFFLRREKK